MRRVSLAARRAQSYLRRPPRPRWFRPALLAGCGLLALGTLAAMTWWVVAGGALAEAGAALRADIMERSREAGLVVRQVFVDGRQRTPPEALREALGFELGAPLLGVDPARARERLEQLVWVEQASVARRLPDGVEIGLLERRPLALWQVGGRFALIDADGEVIEGAVTDRASAARYAHLRVVVGADAPRHAAELFALLSTEPELWSRVVAAIRVGERRWTVRLDDRIDVLLPEHDVRGAWRLLADQAREKRLLERAIDLIDLRFAPERMRLRLAADALEGRGA